MGFRFRKSFKIAPGVKVNIGKKSMGISIGGKYGGISHNTRTGTRARVTAYGTGLSYSTKVGGNKMKKTKETTNLKTNNGGCLMTILKGCLYIIFLPFYWIYGVIWFIFLRKKLNDNPEKQKKETTKYIIFTTLSLLLFGVSMSTDSSSETTEPTAIITESETSTRNNAVAENSHDLPAEELSKEESKTTVENTSSKENFETTVIDSSSKEITEDTSQSSKEDTENYTQLDESVAESEEQNKTEIVDNSIENDSTTQSTDADNNHSTPETTPNVPEQSSTPVLDTHSQSDTTIVWIDDTAKRYHSKNGCGMNNAYQVTLEEALAKGKTPCGRCYK